MELSGSFPRHSPLREGERLLVAPAENGFVDGPFEGGGAQPQQTLGYLEVHDAGPGGSQATSSARTSARRTPVGEDDDGAGGGSKDVPRGRWQLFAPDLGRVGRMGAIEDRLGTVERRAQGRLVAHVDGQALDRGVRRSGS